MQRPGAACNVTWNGPRESVANTRLEERAGTDTKVRRQLPSSRSSTVTGRFCWSSNSAASGRAKRCARTVPLPRSRSLPPALLVVVQGSHLRRQWRCDCLRGTEIGRACSESDTARERVRCGARRVRKHEATPNRRSAYERITPSPSSTAAASAADAGVVEGRDRGDAVAREGEHHEPAGTRDWTVGVPVSPPRF
jgi:hypothetical protein